MLLLYYEQSRKQGSFVRAPRHLGSGVSALNFRANRCKYNAISSYLLQAVVGQRTSERSLRPRHDSCVKLLDSWQVDVQHLFDTSSVRQHPAVYTNLHYA